MRNIHQHFEREFLLGDSDSTENLEATEMRSQKNAAATAFDLIVENFFLVNSDVEPIEPSLQEVNAIENCTGEKMKMPENMPPARRTAVHQVEILVRSSPRCACGDQEIERDWIQEKPGDRP